MAQLCTNAAAHVEETTQVDSKRCNVLKTSPSAAVLLADSIDEFYPTIPSTLTPFPAFLGACGHARLDLAQSLVHTIPRDKKSTSN